jgi:hypothetical protein
VRNGFSDVAEYQKAWRPVLCLEAARLSQGLNNVLLQGISLQWNQQMATFSLPASLVSQLSLSGGFACVRYAEKKQAQQPFTWVAHCQVVKVSDAGAGEKLVQLKMVQSRCSLPTNAAAALATVEWIPLHHQVQ